MEEYTVVKIFDPVSNIATDIVFCSSISVIRSDRAAASILSATEYAQDLT